MTIFPQSPEFKRAAIDWLLANGECESMTRSTGTALAYLTVYGVDYDASDMPDFTRVAIDSGDSFTEATYGDAFACRVYSANPEFAGKPGYQRLDDFEFWIGKDNIERILLSQMIVGVVTAADTGDADWKARAYPREVEHLNRQIAAATERARRAATDKDQ